MINTEDKKWMARCFALAKKGSGTVSPNPMVGAVIIKNGKKIAEGFHERYGSHHAEVNAIRQALAKKIDLRGATIYINVEPCFHFGKTPPCVDAIVKHGFAQVIIATEDPNPLVSGKSIKKLREHGMKVKTGVLRKQAELLNEKFLKYIVFKTPFVALKAAQTADGFIAKEDGSSRWITNKDSRRLVHQLRNEYDAVLVGAGTVIKDDPQLTVRSVNGRNPVRVVIDGNFSVPITSKVFNSAARTILYISQRSAIIEHQKVRELSMKGIDVIALNEKHGKLKMHDIVQDLTSRRLISVLIEGGQRTYSEFLNKRLVDKFYLFTAKKKFYRGIKTFGEISVSFRKKLDDSKYINSDRYQEFSIKYR